MCINIYIYIYTCAYIYIYIYIRVAKNVDVEQTTRESSDNAACNMLS